MPFSADAFFSVFARYNQAIWPLQIAAYLLGFAVIAFLVRRSRASSIAISLVLAAMWAVNGIGYHWLFFAAVNPAAGIFGVLFLIQAILLAASHWIFSDRISFAITTDARSVCGLVLMVFALLVYPLWGHLSGHAYPATPVFGVAPCPTVIFSTGVLLMGNWRTMRWLLIIPGVWAAIGGSAAFLLGVPQDSGLIVGGLILVFFYLAHWRNLKFAEHLTPA